MVMVMLRELHHADLIIPNGSEAIARAFYCDLLGLKEIEKPQVLKKNGGLWLQLGNAQIHLSYEKREGIDPRRTKAHIAFKVSDLESLISELQRRGHPVTRQEQLPGMIRFESEDPFGHRLEFLQII
jgi:catechol 2,3-dioxygenase-like lactoylglutathione lyase family enzyme